LKSSAPISSTSSVIPAPVIDTKPLVRLALSLYDYTATSPDEVTMKEGDMVSILEEGLPFRHLTVVFFSF